MPVTIPVTLPDDLADQAKAKGLLSPESLVLIIGEAVKSDFPGHPENPSPYPSDFDPRLEGAVNPQAFKRGKIVGDIVSPLDIRWEAGS